jgi:Zn-dependent membrane protease YugP
MFLAIAAKNQGYLRVRDNLQKFTNQPEILQFIYFRKVTCVYHVLNRRLCRQILKNMIPDVPYLQQVTSLLSHHLKGNPARHRLKPNAAMFYLLGIGLFLISALVRSRFTSVMNGLSRVSTSSGLSGREVAEEMLRDYGIHDVQVISVDGQLSDHYNPQKRTVNLSDAVFHERSITAAAVAAHECGHAVQHATNYHFLQLRSSLVPVVSVASRYSMFVILGGAFVLQLFHSPLLLLIGIIMFAAGTLFSFITLPVEFDASKRALAWLQRSGMTKGEEYALAKKGLTWAAMTYVVAAIGSLAYLLYYINMFLGSRR